MQCLKIICQNYNKTLPHIPDNLIDDVRKLWDYINNTLNIKISFQDTYLLWSKISSVYDAMWLPVDFGNIDQEYWDDPKNFILHYMRQFGTIYTE